jgi:hypothetical protein
MATTYKIIDKYTLPSNQSSVSFTSISSSYTDLQILVSARIDRAGYWANMKMTFNSSSSSYTQKVLGSDGSAPDWASSSALNGFGYFYAPANSATSNVFSNHSIYIPNYLSSNYKSVSIDGTSENNGTDGNNHIMAGLWTNAAAINSIEFSTYSGSDLVAGSTFYIYGIKNS